MKQQKKKRIGAWIGAVFLMILILATFIFAMIDAPWAYDLFKLCLGGSIAYPILFYAIIAIHNYMNKDRKKH